MFTAPRLVTKQPHVEQPIFSHKNFFQISRHIQTISKHDVLFSSFGIEHN